MSWKQFQIILFIEQFIIKGWEIGILLILPILVIKGEISLIELGILSTTLSLSQFGFSLISGQLMLRLGNKKIMLMSMLLAVVPWILLSTNPNLLVMIGLYFMAGASTGLYETFAISIVANNLEKGKRSEGLADLGMMGDAGRILFTGITTIMVASNGPLLFSLINSGVGVVLLVALIWILLKYKLEFLPRVTPIKKLSNPMGYFGNKQLRLAFIVGSIDAFSSASLFIFLPILFQSKGLPFNESGILSVLLFMGYMMGRKILGKLADRIGTVKTLVIGETFMAVVIIAIIMSNNFVVLMILLMLLGMAARGTSPVCKALVVDSIPDHMSTENGVSIYISVARLANIISRPIFSGVVGSLGIVWVFWLSAVSALMTNIPLTNAVLQDLSNQLKLNKRQLDN